MTTTLADRLAQVANTSTLRLTHDGRRSGMPYEVPIWFMVEDEAVDRATANRKRQWPRNVAVPYWLLQPSGSEFGGIRRWTGRLTRAAGLLFSRSIQQSVEHPQVDDPNDYLPCQKLSEFVRAAGFDGIK